MAVVWLLPAIHNLKRSGNKHMLNIRSLFSVEILYDIKGSLLYLLAGTFDSKQGIVGEYPLIYYGSLSVILVLLLFVTRNVSKKEKHFMVY